MSISPALVLSDLEKGELVWFDPGVGHVLPGEVLEYHKPAQVLNVQAVIAGKPQIFSLTSSSGVHRRQDLGQNGLEDMIQLSDLNEASLLWNLKIRYDKELIYTYVGSILVAVNPYKMYDMYGLDMVKKYEGQILGTLSPHLFAIGSAAYSALASSGSQVVVISGESGSGKTECTKLVMQYLAAVNKSPSNLITEQILEASPLLESFGNAKTVRNDNSSRFGKFLQVHFKDGVILGAKVTEYLLEKSRIVTQAPEERNYHVFYELLSGLSDDTKLKYGLLSPDKYFYLNQGGNCEIDGKYDGEDFQSLMSAMQVLGFTSEEQDTIFRILASVLHLGNVYFHRKQLKHGQEGVEIGSDAEIRWTGHLLKLEVDGIKQALTTKTTEARNERLLTSLTIDQALDTRDAFAKALYSSLFAWLVARINHIVYKGTKKTAAISILDIFGFEDFKENSFEQLCINYANENLQFYFNKHIFKLEQQEYIKEKISWQNITFTDNVPVIHLLSKKPVGILHLLDDESNFPKATDVSFLEKCHYNHALNEFYSRPRLTGPEFGVKHYAGPVWYNVEGFLDKNRDTLRPDVVELLISSSLPMLSKMFSALRSRDEASKTLNKANGRFVTMKPRTPTVAARFHDSLSQLLDSMAKCRPWFVRCIKPNAEKAPMRFDMPTVLEQLRYSGMLETIRIRKLGYPVRLKFSAFIDRYRYLLPHHATPSRGAPLREICNLVLMAYPGEYQLGVSRVFLRETVERTLERRRASLLQSAAVHIQRHIRGLLCRKQYATMRRSAVTIQAAVRGWRERRRYAAVRRGITRAQAQFRGRRQRLRYQRLREELKRRSAAAHQKEQQRKVAPPPLSRDDTSGHDKLARSSSGGMGQLDIPAELAFIWNKLDGWTPPHVDRNLVKVVGPVVEAGLGAGLSLPQDIDQHAFSKFSNIYFKSHVWGMKRDPIKTPFLNKHKDSDFADSLAIFKLILRFMNDDSLTGKKEQALGDYIAYKGLANEKLRDEILCQLVNQTWRNDNPASCERGWLLMANCLSVFPPSAPLYKFLLKYVSDHGYNGYKQLCQRKLLQSHNQWARVHVPSLLEWRANRKRVNMAVQLNFADGEYLMTGVDSWSRCESLCAAVLAERGVAETRGWTLSLERGMAGGKAAQDQRNGLDYVLDAIAEMETSPHFPTAQRGHASPGQGGERVSKMSSLEVEPMSRRPTVPPPQPPPSAKMMKEKARSVSRDEPLGLSRQSALNDRYFDPSTATSAPSGSNKQSGGRSRSLDNLLTPMSIGMGGKLETMGLSKSRLNDRYHSMERIQEAALPEEGEGEKKQQLEDEDIMESVSQRGENRKYSLTGESSDNMIINNQLDFDYPDVGGNRSEDDRSYIRGHPRFIKSQYAGKRAPPGSHSSKAQIETRHSDNKSEGAKSSAMSDTSEAPSLASHVRRVRVPSQASDVDQFLDDLFSPVLDQLSDARSLAASIKGGGKGVVTQQSGQAQSPPGGSFSFNPMVGNSSPVMSGLLPPQPLLIPSLPVYNAQGMSMAAGPTTPTGQAESPSMLVYQASMQQAFLQSAMAQNIQIQQQLFAQNQALQQLLQQRVSVTEPPAPWHGSPTSPVPAPPSKSSPPSKPQGGSSASAHASFTSVLSELRSRRSSADGGSPPPAPPPLLLHRSTSLGGMGGGAAPPPPPPMPPPPDLADPSEGRPFMDPYGRAKTVRIGKWRWPPPQGDSGDSSFLQFKLKQQRRKTSHEIGDPPENGVVEWEEFEMQSESQGPVSMATSTPNLNNNTSTEVHRGSYKSLEVGAARPSPGSVGKLRISSEMKHKLEMVTANHSLRSTDGKNQRSALPPANKLDSDRRLLLQQQLAGRWGSMDSVDARAVVKEDRSDVQATNIVRSQVDKVWRGAPPPPVVPGGGLSPSSGGAGGQHNPPSRSSSFYDSHTTPPAPIAPRHPPYQSPEHHHHNHSNHHHNHHVEDQAEFSPAPQESTPHPSPSSNTTPSVPAPHLPQPGSGADVSKTTLYPPLTSAYFAYNRVTWKLNVRKEVFSPKETVSSPLVLHLVFCQIVADTLTQPSPRISPEERSEMMQLLEQYGVTMSNMHTGQHKASIKRAVLDMARHWLMYFATIFSISGGHQYPDVQLVAIGHSGIRLGRLDLNHLRVLHNISLEDISESVMSKTGSSLQVVLQSGEKFPIHSPRARQIHTLLHAFIVEGGAVVQMQQESRLTKQWLSENHHAHDNRPSQHSPLHLSHPQQHRKLSLTHSPTPTPMIEDDGKHSLLQFAMHHFRQFENMKSANGELTVGGSGRKKSSNDWTWREQLDLVKFTCVPISEPLLRLEPPLGEIAVECFECIMRFMGDLPTTPDLTEVKCVYTILMHCHTHEPLRDEVYSQLMKQTTSNKTESCQRGWRLLSIVAAYFTCSDTLRPFLLKYLETAAYDKRRAFHGTASVCLQNLRKTLRYGGRKNVPSVEEVTAVSAGRNSKRQLYRLPGGSETVINTKSTTVVEDICIEMCQLINVSNDLEMEEFSLYCIVEGDAFTMPLAKEEYILDVTTELHKNQQVFYLIFCRSVWYFPLRLDCQLYVQVLFNQIAPDYLEGLLLVLPNEQIPHDTVYDVAKLAALLHRAADMSHPPAMKETKFLLPKPALTQRDIKPATWVQMVQGHWSQVASLHSIQAKAQLLELLSQWPLFGSSFFAVKRSQEQQILALNKQGVHFLHLLTHETISTMPYGDVISTRKVRAESGTLYLEMKCGNLFQQRVARIQTDQAHEIARLIRQYMSLDRQKSAIQ